MAGVFVVLLGVENVLLFTLSEFGLKHSTVGASPVPFRALSRKKNDSI